MNGSYRSMNIIDGILRQTPSAVGRVAQLLVLLVPRVDKGGGLGCWETFPTNVRKLFAKNFNN